MNSSKEQDFAKIAQETREPSFAEELWTLIRQNKKYWMAPIIIVLLLLGLFVVLSTTAAAPFIYTLF